MSISIVMPCYNEEEIIEKVVRAHYSEVVSKIDDSELIVIDDCSTDNTYRILQDLKGSLPRLRILKTSINSGHGKALRKGYEASQKEWVFQVDSDNQFDVRDFWQLYEFKEDFVFILGFRGARQDHLSRVILSRIIRLIISFLFGVRIKDANCPFRLMNRKVLNDFLRLTDREASAPNIMISILAKQNGIKMVEVPVTHYARKTGVNSIANWKLIRFALAGFKQLVILKKAER